MLWFCKKLTTIASKLGTLRENKIYYHNIDNRHGYTCGIIWIFMHHCIDPTEFYPPRLMSECKIRKINFWRGTDCLRTSLENVQHEKRWLLFVKQKCSLQIWRCFKQRNDLKRYSDLFCHLIYILDSINLTNLPPFLVSAHSQSVLVSKFVQYMLINLFPER